MKRVPPKYLDRVCWWTFWQNIPVHPTVYVKALTSGIASLTVSRQEFHFSQFSSNFHLFSSNFPHFSTPSGWLAHAENPSASSDYVCDVVKQNELELANTVFKIQPNKADSFFCFLFCFVFVFVFVFFCSILKLFASLEPILKLFVSLEPIAQSLDLWDFHQI